MRERSCVSCALRAALALINRPAVACCHYMRTSSERLTETDTTAPLCVETLIKRIYPAAVEPKISPLPRWQPIHVQHAEPNFTLEGWTPRDDRPAHPEPLRRAAGAAASTSSEQAIPYTRLSQRALRDLRGHSQRSFLRAITSGGHSDPRHPRADTLAHYGLILAIS